MTPSARLQATIDLLDAIQSTGRPADGVVSTWLRQRRYIGSKDRAEITGRVYQLLRHYARLGWWIERAQAMDTPRARAIASVMLLDDQPVETIETLFDGERYSPGKLLDDEYTLARSLSRKKVDDPAMPEWVRSELPEWAAAPLRRAFGEDFDREVMALLDAASVDLRVNEARAERDEVVGVLGAAGIQAKPTPMSPLGLRLVGRPQVAAHPAFRSGLVEVQDEGSQIVGLLVDARPGQQVVDFCSGAGGKALLMAARMQGKGRIVACDVSEGRLTRAKERIRRAVVDNIEPKLLESERDRWVKKQKGKFDRVLIDAPCSGTGAWRRNPDARWRPIDLARLTALQAEILDSAARLAKPGGGRAIYATCSLLREENEDQVERFLAAHPEWRVLPVAEIWPEAVGGTAPETDGPYLRLTPARHGTDGFFVAILERGEPVAKAESGPALAELERDDLGPADSDASAELEEALAP